MITLDNHSSIHNNNNDIEQQYRTTATTKSRQHLNEKENQRGLEISLYIFRLLFHIPTILHHSLLYTLAHSVHSVSVRRFVMNAIIHTYHDTLYTVYAVRDSIFLVEEYCASNTANTFCHFF